MPLDFSAADQVIQKALGHAFPAAQIVVRQRGEVIFSGAYGWLDPETRQQPTRPDALFDLASVTKLFVVTALMTLVEEGRVGLDQPVVSVLPDFSGERPIRPYEDPLKPGAFVAVTPDLRDRGDPEGLPAPTVDAGRVTFRNLLAHNSGLPAWRPLYKEGSPAAARRLALATHFAYPTGARTIYSDIGLILLGLSIERLTGLSLDEAVRQRVTGPLGILGIRYYPVETQRVDSPTGAVNHDQYPISNLQPPISNIAPTEICAWRGRRIVGEVHDENAYGLGGVAGHAGLFGSAQNLATFGQSFLDARQVGKSANQQISKSANRQINESTNQHIGESAMPETEKRALPNIQYPIPNIRSLLRAETVAEMIRLQSQDGMTRRGLGFALWCPDSEASGNPFSPAAFGHTGFTGTSLWIDPERSLVVAACTNRVYFGRDAGGILEFRVALHRAIVETVDRGR